MYNKNKARKPIARKLRRRWYFDAKIGKNVPLLGGTGIRLGTRGVKKIVRREINRQEETKIFVTNDLKSTALNSNTLYTLSPLTITVGTGSNQRIGKDIYLRHLRINMAIHNTATQQQVQYRVMVLWSDLQYVLDWSTYVNSGGSSLGSSEIFYGSNNYTGAMIDNKRQIKVICDKLFVVTSPVSGQVVKRNFHVDCPLFQKVTFINSGNNILKDMQLYVVVIPYAPNGATPVGDFSAQALLTYKDA